MAGRLGAEEFLDAVRDRHRRACHEQPERGEQRPDVGFPAVTERVREVGRAAGPPAGDQQEDLVAGVRPRMRRLGQDRRRPGHHGSGRLRRRYQDVGAEGDQHRGDTLRPAAIARPAHRPKQVMRPAVGPLGHDGCRSLLTVLLVRHQPVLTHRRQPREQQTLPGRAPGRPPARSGADPRGGAAEA